MGSSLEVERTGKKYQGVTRPQNSSPFVVTRRNFKKTVALATAVAAVPAMALAQTATNTRSAQSREIPDSRTANLVAIGDQKTFYVIDPRLQEKFTSEERTAGFDINPTGPGNFIVFGPATIAIEFFPWVDADTKKCNKEVPGFSAKIKIDGKEFDLPTQYISEGNILSSSTSEINGKKQALWNRPIRTTINIPNGAHELTIIPSYETRVHLLGLTKTSTPEVLHAPEVPFEEDPDMPDAVSFPCGADVQGNFTGEIPLPQMSPALKYMPNSPDVFVELTRGEISNATFAKYMLSQPFEPGQATYQCKFERQIPPARSRPHSTGPESFPLDLDKTGTIDPKGPQPPGKLTCKLYPVTAKPARTHVHCWGKEGIYAATLDTRQEVQHRPRRYTMRKR